MKHHRIIGLVTILMTTGFLASGSLAAPPDEYKSHHLLHMKAAHKIRWSGTAKLSISDAVKAATDKVPGKVVEAELESEDGVLVWEVEVVTAENKLVKVFIDPQNGTLIIGQPIGGAEGMPGGPR